MWKRSIEPGGGGVCGTITEEHNIIQHIMNIITFILAETEKERRD